MKTRILPALALILCLSACSTFYRSVIGLEAAMDSAAKEYARLHNDGLIHPDVQEKATKAHGEYQKLAGVAHDALVAYKISGDPAKFREAFAAAHDAAIRFADLIVPYLTREKARTISTSIENATTL